MAAAGGQLGVRIETGGANSGTGKRAFPQIDPASVWRGSSGGVRA